MKALVTGGAGFIGSHIADRLLERGYHVRVVDNLQPRVHPKGKPAWVKPEIEFIHGDVRDKDVMKRAMEGVEIISHQAAYQDYMPDFSTFLSTNATSTALIMELIVEMKLDVKKVAVASSQAAYGEGRYACPEHGAFESRGRSLAQLERGEWEVKCPACGRDSDNLPLEEHMHNPFNAYALSKLFEEMTALRLGRLHGIPATAFRYSITQGPRQSLYNSYSGVNRIFCLRLLHDLPPVIYEDGMQKRDYVHIDDVVAANLLAFDDPRTDGEPFNVGSGRATTVRAFASELTKMMGKNIAPSIPGEFRMGDNRHSVSSIEKLKALGWAPKRTIADIFTDYVAWIQGFGDVGDYFREADKLMREAGAVRAVKPS
ncbi:MAG TPA: SDR family NAD(P)-dependent oxidoreductase [Candidatus Hydrogenedentes bacterium]|nr:SDR family NAD(P)-dependent oxidoreductase [Candidatus Hydrogenedentota bacterium]HOS01800.1 SDR family NAD(P)-dependent oxidoreductase [Candidatus Hydrogenedentota bacterium]